MQKTKRVPPYVLNASSAAVERINVFTPGSTWWTAHQTTVTGRLGQKQSLVHIFPRKNRLTSMNDDE